MSIEYARKSIDSNDPLILSTALETIKQEGSLADIQLILPLTKNRSPKIAKDARVAVCSIIKTKLVADFNSLNKKTRLKLATLMETLEPTIVKEIAADLFSNERDIKVRAVQIIGLLKKNPQVRALIAKLVTDRDEHIRATAASLLHNFESPEEQKIVMSLLNDNDLRVRANTVETLENTANPRMVPILKRFRKVDGNRMRGNVLKALYNLGFKEIEPDLLEMMNQDDKLMQASALWVITQIKVNSDSIVNQAAFFLTTDNEMVLDNAKKALNAINIPKAKGYLKYLDFSSHLTSTSDNNTTE